jgi:bifunctional DNase/RNase
MIEMVLSRIIISDKRDTQFIWLKEREGERTFAILIGPYEARAIDMHVKNFKTPRPLTHELLANVITDLNGILERIEITELRDGIYFAKLVIRQDGRVVEVDSRPSDAIALALKHNSPIFCAEKVIEEAAQLP